MDSNQNNSSINHSMSQNGDDDGTQSGPSQPIKQTLRSIREDYTENKLEYTNPQSNKLEKTLDKVDLTMKRAKKASDAVSGLTVTYQLTLMGKERIKNVHCEFRSFNGIEFMNKLRSMLKSGGSQTISEEDDDANDAYSFTKANILKFSKVAMPYFKIPPRPTFLLGALDKETPVIQRKQRKQKEHVNLEAVKTNIQQLNSQTIQEDTNKTITEIERIYNALKKYYKKSNSIPVCLFEFIIHPTSFSRTIENMFYLSFLVKDGYAKIFIDKETNLPVIEPLQDKKKPKENNEAAAASSSAVNVQSVISLSKLEWKELIEVFEIEEPLIPDPKPK